MSLFKQFTHVSVTVTDVGKAREFYSSVLGFQEIDRPAFNFPGIWYSLGGDLQLHIILNDALVPPSSARRSRRVIRTSRSGRTTVTRRRRGSRHSGSCAATCSPGPPGCARSS